VRMLRRQVDIWIRTEPRTRRSEQSRAHRPGARTSRTLLITADETRLPAATRRFGAGSNLHEPRTREDGTLTRVPLSFTQWPYARVDLGETC